MSAAERNARNALMRWRGVVTYTAPCDVCGRDATWEATAGASHSQTTTVCRCPHSKLDKRAASTGRAV